MHDATSSAVSRRAVLAGIAASAAATLVGCSTTSSSGSTSKKSANPPTASASGGSSAAGNVGDYVQPLPKPAKFFESPSLTGKGLPPVEQRLPQNPYVIPHKWSVRGKYGGTAQTVMVGSTGMANASGVMEFFYGFSPVRYLNDGLDVGPNGVEKWSSNDDTSQWTLVYRKGLKWSDGVELDVDDVIFWYEEIAKPNYDGQVPPDFCISSKGNLCQMRRVDQWTLEITYDTPTPLLPYNLAYWANGGIGATGPVWILPKHYLKQFHPHYNPKVPKTWDSPGGLWEQKADWKRNPDCPTIIGYKCKSFDNNSSIVLERNPYYYAVTKDGDQLPYIDEWTFTLASNAQAALLQVQQGSYDFVHGPYANIGLAQISGLKEKASSGNYNVRLWDSGSGTASIFFLNYDYIAKDKKYGTLFRDKRFMQAISWGFDRNAAWKSIYYQSGAPTTGTAGAKISEFSAAPDGPKMFKQWQDKYLGPNIAKAKALLAQLGLKDTNGDGYVEFPDGSELTVEVPYSADINAEGSAKDDQLVADMKKIGLRMRRDPIPPTAFSPDWTNGQLMSHTNWEISNVGTCLVYPQWLVPLEPTRWAPLEGTWVGLTGSPKQKTELSVAPLKRHPPRMEPEKGGVIARLETLYNQAKGATDSMKRNQLVWQMMRIHIDEGPFFIGPVTNYVQPAVCDVDMGNVPTRDMLRLHGVVNPWGTPTPGVYDTEAFFWNHPDKHKV